MRGIPPLPESTSVFGNYEARGAIDGEDGPNIFHIGDWILLSSMCDCSDLSQNALRSLEITAPHVA